MTMLLTPAFGRLLPLPLLQPWAWEAAFAVALILPTVGAWSDVRRTGRVHEAWAWGIATIVVAFIMTEAITCSPVGTSIYYRVTKGSLGASVAPLEFAAAPGGPIGYRSPLSKISATSAFHPFQTLAA